MHVCMYVYTCTYKYKGIKHVCSRVVAVMKVMGRNAWEMECNVAAFTFDHQRIFAA